MDMSQMMEAMKEKAPEDKMSEGGDKTEQLQSLIGEMEAMIEKAKAMCGEDSGEEESPEEDASEPADAEDTEASDSGTKKPKVAMIIAMLKKKKQAEGKY